MIFRDIKGTIVPALGLGTLGLKGPAGIAALRAAIEIGYRHIDTAHHYDNEAEIGDAMASSGVRREEFFVTTKLWRTDLGREDVHRHAEDSLRRLKTDYVDLLLIHWPNSEIPLDETLWAFSEVKAAGRARAIGVSNFTNALLTLASDEHGADLFCNQVEYHPFLDQSTVQAELARRGMLLTAYLPLARGAVAEEQVLQSIAARHGRSPQQITLRWLVQQDGVAAVPRSARREHLQANFEIFDFALSDDEMDAIDRLRGGRRLVNPPFAPAWDTP